jgi:hypothetical protein
MAFGESVPLEKPFDALTFNQGCVLVQGPKGAGKSTFVQNILQSSCIKFDACFVFSSSKETREQYKRIVWGTSTVVQNWSSSKLQKLEADHLFWRRRKDPNFKIMIVFDDCFHRGDQLMDPTVYRILQNGQLDGINKIVSLEAFELPCCLRSFITTIVSFGIQASENILQKHEALVFDVIASRARRSHLFKCKASFPVAPSLYRSTEPTEYFAYLDIRECRDVVPSAHLDDLVHALISRSLVADDDDPRPALDIEAAGQWILDATTRLLKDADAVILCGDGPLSHFHLKVHVGTGDQDHIVFQPTGKMAWPPELVWFLNTHFLDTYVRARNAAPTKTRARIPVLQAYVSEAEPHPCLCVALTHV